MSLLVTGTIGIDTIDTPHGSARDVLGGSAAYFALAAGVFTRVQLVGAVGEDFPAGFLDLFGGKRMDAAGLERRSGSKTFRWHGRYFDDMNQRESLRTELNVVGEAPPKIPSSFRGAEYVFLANTHPAVQREFLEQLDSPRMVVCDTMDLWIEAHREELLRTLRRVHGIVLNDGEARMLTGRNDLLAAAGAVLEMGPWFVIVKKGEHGSMLATREDVFALPAYPTRRVKDPTGAGDSFAGGLMGYLAGTNRTDAAALRSAMARGTCTASIAIEDFSVNSIAAADRAQVDSRLAELREMLMFE